MTIIYEFMHWEGACELRAFTAETTSECDTLAEACKANAGFVSYTAFGIGRDSVAEWNGKISRRNLLATNLAESVVRVRRLTQRNFPHRSPEWAYDRAGKSEMQAAMNALLDAENAYADHTNQLGYK